ncbi:SurA N-terminal domain-containing protein [Desulfobaculum sp. SPO524]|uniref:SurA N-terminal domain-containing protein n=1 Tax=Desulfobaculum sp. SPO524 TaxID=3378071 RepID=UPI0038525ACE
MLDGMRQNAGSWIVKILFGIIIVVFVFAFGSGTMSNRGKGGAVLAYVDETPILIRDFEMAYQRAAENYRGQNPGVSAEEIQTPAFKQSVFNSMVNDVLVSNEAQKLGITASEEEVRAHILDIPAFRNQDNAFDNTVYQAVLRGSHLRPAQFEADVERGIREQKLRKHLSLAVNVTEQEARDLFRYAGEQARLEYQLFPWQDYTASVTPTDAEIDAYYKANEERFRRPATVSLATLTFTPQALASGQDVSAEEIAQYYEANTSMFKRPEMVSARHILVKLSPNAPEAAVKAARSKLATVKAKLAKGAKFSDLAEEYSEGPSAVRGGDLGYFPRSSMVKPFEDVAFSLKPGQVSDPVRTQFGLHLIKVDDKRAAGVKSLDEARSEIRRIIAEEKATSAMSDKLDQALEQILVDDSAEKIASDLGMKLQQTGPMSKQTLVSALGISEEDADLLFDLPLSTATDSPLNVKDGYILAFKQDSEPSTIAPLDAVKEQIVEALKRKGAMALAQEAAQSSLKGLTAEGNTKKAEALFGKASKVTSSFGRQGFIPGLGMNPDLVETVFTTKEGEWLPQTYSVQDGVLIARVQDRIEPSEELWEQQKQLVLDTLTRTKQREVYLAYLNSLRDKAKTEIVEPRVLQ